jgi:hypothetical protein
MPQDKFNLAALLLDKPAFAGTPAQLYQQVNTSYGEIYRAMAVLEHSYHKRTLHNAVCQILPPALEISHLLGLKVNDLPAASLPVAAHRDVLVDMLRLPIAQLSQALAIEEDFSFPAAQALAGGAALKIFSICVGTANTRGFNPFSKKKAGQSAFLRI